MICPVSPGNPTCMNTTKQAATAFTASRFLFLIDFSPVSYIFMISVAFYLQPFHRILKRRILNHRTLDHRILNHRIPNHRIPSLYHIPQDSCCQSSQSRPIHPYTHTPITPIHSVRCHQPAFLHSRQQSCIVICHAQSQAGASQIFTSICCFHAGKCQIRSSGMPQADRDQKLNRMVVILRDCSSIICFQHSSGLPECSVKKLESHTALSHLFWQTCRILLISENMVILGNHRQIRVKYQI